MSERAHCRAHGKYDTMCIDCWKLERERVRQEVKELDAPDPPAPLIGARNTDPDTSHEAVPTLSESASTQHAILETLAAHGAMTEEECAIITGVPRTSLSPQFKPMIRAGLIINLRNADGSLMKRKNPTSGKKALVRGLPHQQTKPMQKASGSVENPRPEAVGE